MLKKKKRLWVREAGGGSLNSSGFKGVRQPQCGH